MPTSTDSSYKNQRAHTSEPLLAAGQQQRAEAARPQNDKAMDEASALTGIEPAVHVPAGLEGGKHLLGDRDLAAIARVSSGAGPALLDREYPEVAQLYSIPRAKPAVIVSKMALMIFSTSHWYRCGFSAVTLSISSDLIIRAFGRARSQAGTGRATPTEAGGAMLKLSAQAVIVESDGRGAPDPSLVGGNGAFRQVQSTMTARSGREPAP